MLYRRKTYNIQPEKLNDFNDFFHTYLYPNQIKHGAKLIGRWVNEAQDEIVAMWAYRDKQQYEEIERNVKSSDLHKMAQEKRKELGALYIESRQEFFTATTYCPPQHIVAVSAYITNEAGEVLLVRNLHRADTMEMPGGQVEEGETLESAIRREVLEETGVQVRLHGITGIYQNLSSGVVCVVFRGAYEAGEARPAAGETSEALFVKPEEAEKLITREQFLVRLRDARAGHFIPHEAFRVRPYELVSQFEVKQE
ncbi:NUDIX domain-containing protein [Ectobacillus sp. JY-23]|uniref:NUDIX domain-containing protein n=1 Tax=Ectobacillus sp. JY-23 TaxID=2933872 RepID=UPI001FF21730|nr:NUDIX domain-containing protein [Ectobacillus sp. JY-23]UOY92362.1 NUDIX domain-containing protein [Ectobacillus sp. JY-23]